MESVLTIVLLSFVLLGFAVLGIAFWAVIYPKVLCQKCFSKEEEWNVCIRPKGHDGRHMSVNGKSF